MPSLALVPPPAGGVFRITLRAYEAFSPPPWEIAKTPEGRYTTFGNRFDDPREDLPPAERYRCIYVASSPQAAFGEVLSRLVPSPRVIQGMGAIEDDAETLEDALGDILDPVSFRPGEQPHHLVPVQWRLARQVGHATLDHRLRFIDLDDPRTIAYLSLLFRREIDLSHLTSGNRSLTQRIARSLWEHGEIDGFPVGGIRYMSRLGAEWECWALFDTRVGGMLTPELSRDIPSDDADLLAVSEFFGLTTQPLSGHHAFERPWQRSEDHD